MEYLNGCTTTARICYEKGGHYGRQALYGRCWKGSITVEVYSLDRWTLHITVMDFNICVERISKYLEEECFGRFRD